MSSGKEHEVVARWLPAVSCVVAPFTTPIFGWKIPIACIIGQLIGVYCLTPDADMHTLTVNETRWFREPRRGDILSWVSAFLKFPVGIASLVMGWFPGLFLNHRGISHVPVIGAAVITFLVIVNPLILALLSITDSWQYLQTEEALAAWIGFSATHLIHIIMDK